MIVGIPKEIKDNEYRVGMVPAGVKALTDEGHTVLLEEGAGVLLALPELVALVRVPGTGLADDALLHPDVDERTLARDGEVR